MTLSIRPITFRAACAFVEQHHRHNRPPRGQKFSVAVCQGISIVGVAMAGRPVARHFDDGFTLEINRTCTTGEPNANSMLYGACRRTAFGMGYRRVITYTQADEPGTSLHASGFVRVKDIPARTSWAAASVKLKAIRDPVGNGGVSRVLWEIVRGGSDERSERSAPARHRRARRPRKSKNHLPLVLADAAQKK